MINPSFFIICLSTLEYQVTDVIQRTITAVFEGLNVAF